MTVESILTSGLPVEARWFIHDTPLDFDFTVGSMGLYRLPVEVLEGGDSAWSELLVFGEYDYCEGGGARPWLCIHERDGSVLGFDAERDSPIFLFNSSVERFVATFKLLNDYLAQGRPLPADCESRLSDIDREAYSNSDWRHLVEHRSAEQNGR